jgi:hypothetical protein
VGCCDRRVEENVQRGTSSPSIIRMIKSKIMGWVGHLVHIREGVMRNTYRILVGKPKDRDY